MSRLDPWQKIFIAVIAALLVVIIAGAIILIFLSNSFTLQSETEIGIVGQELILPKVTESIQNAEKQYPDAAVNTDSLVAIMRPIAETYKQQGILLALLRGNTIIYSNIPNQNKDLAEIPNNSRLPDYPHLMLVYTRAPDEAFNLRAIIVIVFLVIILLLITAAVIGLRSFRKYKEQADENTKKLTIAVEGRQQFVDDLTHEMRTPLTSIVGYAEYLQNAKYTERERKVATGHLYYMANRLKNLSDKLMELTFLRGEEIKMRPVVVEELFHDLRVSALPLLIPRNITLDAESELDVILGDETLLLSLLINLVENAGRASKEGGTVKVRAYKGRSNSTIEIADSGRGMRREEVERITEPFFRADKSRSREFGGVGLGLSIAAQIIKLHNAKMAVESAPDIGTVVRIEFSGYDETGRYV